VKQKRGEKISRGEKKEKEEEKKNKNGCRVIKPKSQLGQR